LFLNAANAAATPPNPPPAITKSAWMMFSPFKASIDWLLLMFNPNTGVYATAPVPMDNIPMKFLRFIVCMLITVT
jgi:hypothetical protein